jgi:beta-lactamase class D
MGWFVGWVQKGQQQIIFAHYKQFPGKDSISMGQIVKQEALVKLDHLIKADFHY